MMPGEGRGVVRVIIGPRAVWRGSQRRAGVDDERSKRLRLVVRMAKLIHLCLTSPGLPALPILAKELAVCTRTLRRDLEALAAAGVPVPQRPDQKCATVPRDTSETPLGV